MRLVLLCAATLLLAGCWQQELGEARAAAARDPAGRYQIAGKREYSNGTDFYVLDTKTGRVCTAFDPSDGKSPASYICVDGLPY
ncbi:MAG TPA: hypothetical protein VNM48_00180 [Chloroflexota bacterium]|nr:hypothetical protein [Chloroflexota bacterium]